MRKTLIVTNFSRRTWHGSRHVYRIMANPRHFEFGEGVVEALIPPVRDFSEYKLGMIDIETYHHRFTEILMARYADGALDPGRLVAIPFVPRSVRGTPARVLVEDGDTLCCCCSTTAAAEGRCHRSWAAPLLAKAGWSVILDNKRIS